MKRIVSIATVPERALLVPLVLSRLRPQADTIILHCHAWPTAYVMSLCDRVVLSTESGRTSTEAKFWIALDGRWPYEKDDIHFPCDDDILYPKNYIERLTAEIKHHPGTAAVGVLGAILPSQQITSYRRSIKTVAATEAGLEDCTRVDILGAGTMAYRPTHWNLQSEELAADNACDAAIAAAAARRGFGMVAVKRPVGWLKDMRAPNSLWDRPDRDDPNAAPANLLRQIRVRRT